MIRTRFIRHILKQRRFYYAVKNDMAEKDPNQIAKQIHQKIKATGPITVADYMKEVLTHPLGGYYMHRDVFGESGDFVTSPELNQMFGEMVAVWFLNEWSKMGSPKPLQIVELGPGRGTLSQDLLRVFNHFDALQGASLHLVEISPVLSDIQSRNLCIQSEIIADPNSTFYRQGISHGGISVKWYRQLDDVPEKYSLFVAHEFFDALPIHKFEKTDAGYREILIDNDSSSDLKFRYIMAREATPMSKLLIKPDEKRHHIEISPESILIAKKIAGRVECNGGLALIADYGNFGTGGDTFRAFRRHKLHDPLIEPGSADLTADVDFAALCKIAQEDEDVLTLGPVTQHDFLTKIGIEQRFNKLKATAKAEHLDGLVYGYKMMTEKKQMGERFKFIAFIPSVLNKMLVKFPVVGF